MAHIDNIKKVLVDKGFNLDKIEFSTEDQKYSMLFTGSATLMKEFNSRVARSKKTTLYIKEETYPVIKDSCLEFVRVKFDK